MEKNLADFLAKVQARTEERREKYHSIVTLNYEIEDGVIRFSDYYTDIRYEYGFNLYSVMELIATFTNNNLGSGCTFTIGF